MIELNCREKTARFAKAKLWFLKLEPGENISTLPTEFVDNLLRWQLLHCIRHQVVPGARTVSKG